MSKDNNNVIDQPDNEKPEEQGQVQDDKTIASNNNQDNGERVKQTEMLSLPEDFQPKPMPHREPTQNTSRLAAGWRIIFRIGDQKKALNIEELITIGRGVENEAANSVDFDLTPFGAYHFGVSRHHAIMTLKEGYLYLEDLGSTNGTRINGFQLTANQPYRLRDGDEIEFARLRTSIRFRNPDQP